MSQGTERHELLESDIATPTFSAVLWKRKIISAMNEIAIQKAISAQTVAQTASGQLVLHSISYIPSNTLFQLLIPVCVPTVCSDLQAV
jgi:hypothetical protein